MGSHNLKFVTPNISLFLLSLLFVFLLQVSTRAQDGVCGKVDCGKGTCVPNNGSIWGFDCMCYSGWKQVQFGPVTLPACVIPNCTLDFQCGNSAPPPPPPLTLPPTFNLTDPCFLVWCGDGSCVSNETGHTCQCYEGSANLINSTALPCFNQCSMGADCSGLALGPHVTPPPSTSNGSNNISKGSMIYALNVGLLSVIILSLTPLMRSTNY